MLKLQKETINKLNKFCSTKTMEAKQNNLANLMGKRKDRKNHSNHFQGQSLW